MSQCRIVNAAVEAAVGDIRKIKDDYNNAGEEFYLELTAAIADMEGDSKDAFQEYIEKYVKELVTIKLGDLVDGLAELLEANRAGFARVDKEIADAIR